MSKADDPRDDVFVRRFLDSPTYLMIFNKTVNTAATSYGIARILSIFAFVLGSLLIIAALINGLFGNKESLSAVFGTLGTVNLVALLLFRPIERIQSGVNSLISAQIACTGFVAQYDSVARTLATLGELPLDQTDRKEQLRLATYLRETVSITIADLDQRKPSKPQKNSLSGEEKHNVAHEVQ